MKFLVIGHGSIGARHTRNLLQLGHEVYVADPCPGQPPPPEVWCCYSVDAGLEVQVDAVLICTPPESHIELALQASKYPTFIEKPLADRWYGDLEKLQDVMVATNYRFHEQINFVKQRKPNSLYAEYRHRLEDWASPHSGETGIVMESAYHMIDYAWHIMGPLELIAGGAHKDSAWFSFRANRKRVFLDVDWNTTPRLHQIVANGSRFSLPGDNGMYLKQMKHFVEFVNGGEPICPFDEALEIFKLACGCAR